MSSSPQRMRAAVVRGHRQLAIDEIERPEPGPGEVRVRLEACGICGSDLHFYHGNLLRPGFTPGHEMAGRIDALGEGVGALAPGDAVAIEPLRSCGRCAYCLRGRDSICRSLELHGVHVQGGMAEQIVVPADRVYPLAAGIDPAVAALSEPIAVAVHGLRRGSFEKGERVLVLGAGSVGLVTLVAARSLGAGEVWISARHPHQARLANALGAHRVLAEDEAGADALDRLGREQDFDLVVETVGGSADTLRSACAAARPGGRISVLGLFMAAPALSPYPLLMKELTLCWSNCYQRPAGERADFALATEIVDRERGPLAAIVTDRLPLAEVNRAFALAADKRAGAIKVSLQPSD